MNRSISILMTTTLAALALAGCTTSDDDHDHGATSCDEVYGCEGIVSNGDLVGTLNTGFIQQAGSSTVLPIAKAWAADFGGERGVQIKVAGGGSGAGGKGICRAAGSTPLDIGDQSRPMKASEHDICQTNKVDPVPWVVAIDGLSVVVSKSNDFLTDLTTEQLAHIFGGVDAPQKWSDVDPSFPDKEIQACAPDAESGTWDYFNEVILEEHGEEPLRDDAERSADDNVLVSCIAGSDAAIGFFGYAYLEENTNKVKSVAVGAVHPTPATIADGTYTPLSRPIFMVTVGVPAPGTILYDYFHYAFHKDGGQRLVPAVGYVALDEGKRQQMIAQLG